MKLIVKFCVPQDFLFLGIALESPKHVVLWCELRWGFLVVGQMRKNWALGECGKKLFCYIKEVCKNTIYKLEYVSSLANYSRMGMLVAYHLPRRPKGWVLVLLLLHVPHLHYQTPPPNIKTTKLKHGPPYAALDSQLKYMPIKLQHGTKFKWILASSQVETKYCYYQQQLDQLNSHLAPAVKNYFELKNLGPSKIETMNIICSVKNLGNQHQHVHKKQLGICLALVAQVISQATSRCLSFSMKSFCFQSIKWTQFLSFIFRLGSCCKEFTVQN